MPMLRYNDRFALRGAKPIRNQSTSLLEAGLLYRLLPKPIIEVPHSTGSSPVAFLIIFRMTKLSLRFWSSLIAWIKSSTLEDVGFVFIWATFDFFSGI